MNKNNLFVTILLTLSIVLLLGLLATDTKSPTIFAGQGSSMILTSGGTGDKLILFDKGTKNILTYQFEMNKGIMLTNTRSIEKDLEIVDSSNDKGFSQRKADIKYVEKYLLKYPSEDK